MFRYMAGVLALGLIPQIASSGPIHWSVTGNSMTAEGGSHVWVGNDTKAVYDPATNLETQTEFILLANIDGGFSWVGTNSERFAALAVGPTQIGSHSLSDGWANNQPNDFLLDLSITDAASGQVGQMSFHASGFADGFFTTGSFVMSLSVEDTEWSSQLGDNLYTVRPVVRRSESADVIEFEVTVAATTHAPEPGTVAIAGIGFAVLGLARLRRRITSRPSIV